MNAKEAMDHAIGGGKLACKGWPKSYFVHFSESGRLVDSDGDLYNFPINVGNWEAYQEPPKEYTFLELFDVLKEDEYATFEDWPYAFTKSNSGLICKHPSGKIAFYSITKMEVEAKYIIKKKPSQPVKEKEGLNFDEEFGLNGFS